MMIDSKSNVVLLLLDLSAAFDTINHNLLLMKLKNVYGITELALNWFQCYSRGSYGQKDLFSAMSLET